MSARGSVSGIDWYEDTKKQLDGWGINYHELIMNKKPHADLFVDDKAICAMEWRKNIPQIRGAIAGCFDILHPGYVEAFKKAKDYCNHLVVLLHENPSLARPEKHNPILSVEERRQILLSLKYVDEVVVYKSENELLEFLKNSKIDIRFIGDDYKNKESFTGHDLDIDIFYINRHHGWSSTKLKNMIYSQIFDEMEII